MKVTVSMLIAPAIVFLTACSTHYAVSSHHGHGHGHRGHVSVSGHSHHGGAVLGALVVGGVIGHMISENSKEQKKYRQVDGDAKAKDDTESVVNGYEITPAPQPEKVQSRWYQLGKDGKCYLMESVDGKSQVVSLVPDYSCN